MLTGVGALLLVRSWGAWADVLIDFGREAYLPWRITQGAVLYRDLAHLSGPLSPYLNALWFSLLGVSLDTLVYANAALLALTTALLYRLLLALSDHLSATASCAAMLVLFGFGHALPVGNYNFITPYAHEMTHGLLLGLAAVGCAWRAARRPGRAGRWTAAGGCAVGLAFLTKPELFVAALAGSVAGSIALFVLCRSPGRRVAVCCGAWLGGLLLPPLAAFLLLGSAMPAEQALRGVLGSWPGILDPRLRELPFYRFGMGTDEPARNVLRLLAALGGYAALLVPSAALAWALRRVEQWRVRRLAALGWGALALVVLDLLEPRIPWHDVVRPLPVVLAGLLLAGIAMVRREAKARGEARERGVEPARLEVAEGEAAEAAGAKAAPARPDHRADEAEAAGARAAVVLRIALLSFSLVLLVKIVLFARVFHYGFVLALPGTLMLLVAALHGLPSWLTRRGAEGRVARAASLAALAVAGQVHLRWSAEEWDAKPLTVSNGRESLRADERAGAVNHVLTFLAERTEPQGSVVVLPEGVMLNYLARRPGSTPYVSFMPVEVLVFGEAAMLEALRERPPDYVLIAARDTTEYGVAGFGRGYAEAIARWVAEQYEVLFTAPAAVEGPRPEGFFIQVRRRREGPAG